MASLWLSTKPKISSKTKRDENEINNLKVYGNEKLSSLGLENFKLDFRVAGDINK